MKYRKILLMVILCFMPFSLVSCSCGLEKYKAQDVKNLYKTTYENQIDVDDGKNSMFSSEYTICVEYAPIIESVILADDLTNNEYNLYMINNVYNQMFKSIFRYYENWQSNFFETADEVLSIEEYNELYGRLSSINTSLISLNYARDKMEEQIASQGILNVPSYMITSYIYTLNDVVEKSLDFVTYFRDLHVAKIFTDKNISTNTVARTIDDMLLNLAQLTYIDNIKPFVIDSDNESVCDLSVLAKAYVEGNSYVKIGYLKDFDTNLSVDAVYALNNYTDETILKAAEQYMYYSDVLRQNIKTLNQIDDNINYYRLNLYRYGVIDGGVEVYSKAISDLENTSYLFLEKIENFISFEYLNVLQELI